ncbi:MULTISPECIES: hypothetical protein [Nocardia]|uniref:hypothetical protein n=1 Tax=Nocardia TaxID=1817 RepID=UPI0013598DC8|nr:MULTISPECIES: hypothetical protein [Nocardia]
MVVDELVGPQAARIRGNGSHADYLEYLLCLIFLLRFESPASIRDRIFYRAGSTGEFLENPERLTHELMLQHAIPAGLETAFRRVEPANIADLERIVEICSTVGTNSFRYLLDLLSHERSASGSEFFTPPRIAALAGALAVGPRGEPGSVYDPYVRGGELRGETSSNARQPLSQADRQRDPASAQCSVAFLAPTGPGSAGRQPSVALFANSDGTCSRIPASIGPNDAPGCSRTSTAPQRPEDGRWLENDCSAALYEQDGSRLGAVDIRGHRTRQLGVSVGVREHVPSQMADRATSATSD